MSRDCGARLRVVRQVVARPQYVYLIRIWCYVDTSYHTSVLREAKLAFKDWDTALHCRINRVESQRHLHPNSNVRGTAARVGNIRAGRDWTNGDQRNGGGELALHELGRNTSQSCRQ